jgi:hypothetical protein
MVLNKNNASSIRSLRRCGIGEKVDSYSLSFSAVIGAFGICEGVKKVLEGL